VVGVSLGEGISCQRILGSAIRFDLHQPCELDIDQVFALKIIILCKTQILCIPNTPQEIINSQKAKIIRDRSGLENRDKKFSTTHLEETKPFSDMEVLNGFVMDERLVS
jgi:hypothetical protein